MKTVIVNDGNIIATFDYLIPLNSGDVIGHSGIQSVVDYKLFNTQTQTLFIYI